MTRDQKVLELGIEIVASMKASIANWDIESGRIDALENTELDRIDLDGKNFEDLSDEDKGWVRKHVAFEKERLHKQAIFSAEIVLKKVDELKLNHHSDVLTAADYEEVLQDKQRLTKELADMLMGSDAPEAPALCDVVSFMRSKVQDIKLPAAIKVISEALESDPALRYTWESTLQNIFISAERSITIAGQSARVKAFKQAAHSFISLIFSK